MNTPVNFELAKLLNDKGLPGLKSFYDNKKHYELNPKKYTIAEVVMWLYKKHGIWIPVYIMETWIDNNTKKVYFDYVIKQIIKQTSTTSIGLIDFSKRPEEFNSPDAGASKKIYKLAEQIGYKGDIITCSKEKDTEGKLTKTVVPISYETYNRDKDFIIIDDICDGEATFLNMVKQLRSNLAWDAFNKKPKIYLIVTHGIFSKGFEELSKYFDGIYRKEAKRLSDIKKKKLIKRKTKEIYK